jgi:V8-like Glu-specific endopeptidase
MKRIIYNKKFHLISALVVCLAVVFLVYSLFFKKDLNLIGISNNNIAEAIVDGIEYSETDYPNVARVDIGGGTCTGTLINANYVITAGHCFFNTQAHKYTGDSKVTKVRLNGKYYQVKSIYIHPTYKSYSGPSVSDVAILKLEGNVPNITPAPLLTTKVPLNTEVTIAGYGLASCGSDHDIPESSLSTAPLGKIYAGTTEFEGFGYGAAFPDPDSKYVYWNFDTCGANTAGGDSGGPTFYDKKLAAITTGGDRPSSTFGVESVNLRVDKIVPWVNNILEGNITATPDSEITFPFLYSYSSRLEFKFTNSFTLTNGYKFFVDVVEYNSWQKNDGKYDLQGYTGLIGESEAMQYYSNSLRYRNVINTLYKKSGTDNYLGQLKTSLIIGPVSDSQTGNNYEIAVIKGIEGNISNSDTGLVDPGWYTLTVFVNSTPYISTNICLPSFTSKTGQKVGTIVCSEQSQNQIDPKSLDNTLNYTVTIGTPIFIKGANNDIVQFNVPLLYKLIADPSNKTQVKESLQAVIYKKNESSKAESSVSLDKQNILYNTQLMYSYQWSELVSGNEYIIYFYDEATNSKSPYINLKYGSDGKLNATTIFTLPTWAANVVDVSETDSDVLIDEPTEHSSTQLSTVDGSLVNFKTTLSKLNSDLNTEKDSLKIKGVISANKPLPNNLNIQIGLYDENEKMFQTLESDAIIKRVINSSSTEFSYEGEVTAPDAVAFKIKNSDLEVSSQLFSLDFSGSGSVISMNGGYASQQTDTQTVPSQQNPTNQNPSDPNTPTNGSTQKRGVFRNPLPEGLDTIPEIVSVLVKGIVIPIAVPLLGLSIIYTGFLFVQARGNETKLTEAKNALKWTLIGGAIILAAYVIAEALQATINDIIK